MSSVSTRRAMLIDLPTLPMEKSGIQMNMFQWRISEEMMECDLMVCDSAIWKFCGEGGCLGEGNSPWWNMYWWQASAWTGYYSSRRDILRGPFRRWGHITQSLVDHLGTRMTDVLYAKWRCCMQSLRWVSFTADLLRVLNIEATGTCICCNGIMCAFKIGFHLLWIVCISPMLPAYWASITIAPFWCSTHTYRM